MEGLSYLVFIVVGTLIMAAIAIVFVGFITESLLEMQHGKTVNSQTTDESNPDQVDL